MTEEYWEKHREDMERDLGVEITPYTEAELEKLNELVRDGEIDG